MNKIPTVGRLIAASAALLSGVFGHPGAYGSDLQVSPVRLNMASGSMATGLTLKNPGHTPIYGQVRVFEWDQQWGEDALRPATDLIASPPLLELGVGASQIVRLVRTSSRPDSREMSYRLLVDEIADPAGAPENGVAIQLRYSIPVFVAPSGNLPAHPPSWTLIRRDGRWVLRLDNTGSVHLQVAALQLVDGRGTRVTVAEGLMGYALGGRYREWRLPEHVAATLSPPVHVEALINGRSSTAVAATR